METIKKRTMNKEIFRFFLRKNFPVAGKIMTSADIDEMGEVFHKYLDNKLNEEQKELIIPSSSYDIASNLNNPLKIHGFHPAYKLHFSEWVEIEKQKQNIEQ